MDQHTTTPAALDPARPFTRAQADAAGISAARLRGPGFTLLHRGVYVAATTILDLRTRCRAALLTQCEGAVLTGVTAASLLGVVVPAHDVVDVGVMKRSDRRPRPGISSTCDPRRDDTTRVHGMLVTTGGTLFLQLAESLSLVDLVVAGDAMVRLKLVGLEDLRDACQLARGRGVRLARRAAQLVRGRVDSAMETRVRLLFVFAGFPEPLVNPVVDGRYRVDLCWAALRLVIEYDGRHHRDDLDQWDHDIRRNEWFETHDWFIVHVVARDVFQRPYELIERVHAVYRERGGPPFRSSQEWRTHFPVKQNDNCPR